jgi:hypothetical protein
MTYNAAQKKAIREIKAFFDVPYQIARDVSNGDRCAFCNMKLKQDKSGMYEEEVGEFWSKTLQNSVLAHPDCLPNGIDAIFEGKDPEWSMA